MRVMDLLVQDLETSNRACLSGEPPEPAEIGKVEPSPALYREIEAQLPRLTRYARSLTHDPVDAEDLVQEVLSRALAKIDLWRPGSDLRAWLFTIMHHQFVNERRRASRQKKLALGDRDQSCAPPRRASVWNF